MKTTSHLQNQKLKRSGQSPYERPNSTTKVKQNKLSEIHSPYLPDTPEVWVCALGDIDQSRQLPKENIPNGRYAFSELGLILYASSTSTDQMLQYLKMWLQYCSILIFQHQLPFILLDAPPAAYGAWSPKQ
ncbi:hypothetical protein Moror_4830 [Moniliophthora roreri MCA 2997]|uniref:Uncharacterized protein n=1 Tax=Moniliophthora roreri (strain MCA 2997) TaxID=1381753 RepID=V2YKH3_MONRO|nr:hypothetical protein Moror_4830 [Moniliophthora roreri MCA 2997]